MRREPTAEPVRAVSLARGVESSMADRTDIARRGAVHIGYQNLPILICGEYERIPNLEFQT